MEWLLAAMVIVLLAYSAMLWVGQPKGVEWRRKEKRRRK